MHVSEHSETATALDLSGKAGKDKANK